MAKEILIQDPDGEMDYDGEEYNESEESNWQEIMEDWRFRMSTYNY